MAAGVFVCVPSEVEGTGVLVVTPDVLGAGVLVVTPDVLGAGVEVSIGVSPGSAVSLGKAV